MSKLSNKTASPANQSKLSELQPLSQSNQSPNSQQSVQSHNAMIVPLFDDWLIVSFRKTSKIEKRSHSSGRWRVLGLVLAYSCLDEGAISTSEWWADYVFWNRLS